MANGNDPKTNRKMGLAYAAGLTLFVSVILLCGVGWLLDRWLESEPWLMVSGLVLGAIVGFYQFVKLTSKL